MARMRVMPPTPDIQAMTAIRAMLQTRGIQAFRRIMMKA